MTGPEIAGDNQVPLPRHQWPRCLLALDAREVRTAAEQFEQAFRIEDVQLPQSGLGLMKIRDGALGELYFPGEIPLATARVRILAADKTWYDGAAQVMDDRASLARAIAVLDGVLANQLRGHETVIPLLHKGQNHLAAQAKERKALLETTRVNFSTLGHYEEDDHA
ncbi:phosphonate C-P lyase system protein PhnG [Marinobacter sp.]|uniref:phosphonate C-P lyase system protein PhnG n=1 Tax=Marinobacter sp. TaxID=50741 RepID=UPI0035646263